MNFQLTIDPEAVISLQNIGVYYKFQRSLFNRTGHWALRDVSFNLYPGESLGVIGRNGSGKSTLMKILAGIIEPNKGSVSNKAGRASLLSINPGFIPHLTGRENTFLGGMLLGMRKQEIARRIGEVIEFSELAEFFDQPLRTYSSGMRARLGFSVAFMADPEILLIDEVFGVGDIDFRKKSSERMKEKLKSNTTVVLVSHNVNLISSMCNRVVWIEKGNVRLEGPPEMVVEQYTEHLKSLKK